MIIISKLKTLTNLSKNEHFSSKNNNRSFIIIFFALLLISIPVQSQILKDSSSIKLVKKGIDYVYNFQFSNAEKVSEEIRKLYPEHPINNLFRGMITYWRNYPLITTSVARDEFESEMRKCIDICSKNKNKEMEAEMLLVNLCARGFLLLFYTDNDMSFEVFPLARSTYQCIRRSFDFTANFLDLYFFTGIYNYYREAYPDAHPVYKTLAFIFPKGSKEKGLADLQIVSKKSIILKAESYAFLTDIFLYFENDFQKATFYSKSLHGLYPHNPHYLGAYIKNLLLIKRYDEAERIILSSENIDNAFFQAQLSIFKGIIQEKKYHDADQAKEFYTYGIRHISTYREFGNEYASYAYFGLSRISEIDGDIPNKKNYRKLAQKLAVARNIEFSD
jgi:hypothetical protein